MPPPRDGESPQSGAQFVPRESVRVKTWLGLLDGQVDRRARAATLHVALNHSIGRVWRTISRVAGKSVLPEPNIGIEPTTPSVPEVNNTTPVCRGGVR